MKKIITLTMIKNEMDIVETFVRYTMNYANKMVFIDNGCTDETINILNSLQREGLNIKVYNESQVYYEQYLLENKYIQKITEEEEFDFLIPLDADEFLNAKENLVYALDGLDENCITIINWKTYVLKNEMQTQGFFLDSIDNVRIHEELTFQKVILPYRIMKNNKIFVTMGHHDVEMVGDIVKKFNDDIYMAHFPVRSKEQIQLKIYQGIITQLMSSYKRVIAFHWKKIFMEMKAGEFDLVDYSQNYALPQEKKINPETDIEIRPFNYSWCNADIKPRYTVSEKVNVLDNIYYMAEIMCLKSIVESQETVDFDRDRILIYGTGNTSKNLFRFLDKKMYNVLAYVDSNEQLEFNNFNDRIIIAPDKIKFFKYDKIVIASNAYEEIKNILRENGVCEDKIFDKSYILLDRISKL